MPRLKNYLSSASVWTDLLWLLLVFSIFATTSRAIANIATFENNCNSTISMIPKKYLDGIKTIRVGDYHYEGQYYWTWQMIGVRKCEISTIIHELAHHKNKMDKHTFKESAKHSDIFERAEDDIWLSINVSGY